MTIAQYTDEWVARFIYLFCCCCFVVGLKENGNWKFKQIYYNQTLCRIHLSTGISVWKVFFYVNQLCLFDEEKSKYITVQLELKLY